MIRFCYEKTPLNNIMLCFGEFWGFGIKKSVKPIFRIEKKYDHRVRYWKIQFLWFWLEIDEK